MDLYFKIMTINMHKISVFLINENFLKPNEMLFEISKNCFVEIVIFCKIEKQVHLTAYTYNIGTYKNFTIKMLP